MYQKVVKRLIDIMLSIIGLPFFIIALIILGPIIYLSDGGAVFYNAERIGKNGKLFKMYKFRSMKKNAPDIRFADGSTYNGEDDPRVTKVGRIMRKTSVDELPQLLNVLIGDMSIIGPRPNLPTIPYELLDEAHKHRLLVRPGITGYNQAYYRNSISPEERTKNDNYYVDNISFVMDIKIFIKTIESVLLRRNIYVSKDSK